MPPRKSDTKPLHRRVQWGTLEAFYQLCETEHRTPEGQLLYIMEEHRKETVPKPNTYLVTVSPEFGAWLQEEARINSTTPGKLLQKMAESYYEGLAFREIQREKVHP